MATTIQQSIEFIDQIFQNEANGTNDLEFDTNFDIFDNFAHLTINIINHYGGKLEHLIADSNTGFSLILIRDLYIMVEYERRQNRSYDFTFRSFYFISTAENYIFGDSSPELDEEPSGVIEDS